MMPCTQLLLCQAVTLSVTIVLLGPGTFHGSAYFILVVMRKEKGSILLLFDKVNGSGDMVIGGKELSFSPKSRLSSQIGL